MSAAEEILIHVNLGPRSYQIPIVSHRLSQSAEFLTHWWIERDGMSSMTCKQPPPAGSVWLAEKRHPAAGTALIVTDSHLVSMHAATVRDSLLAHGWRCETEVLPAGEPSKSLDVVTKVYDRLIAMNADRRTECVDIRH